MGLKLEHWMEKLVKEATEDVRDLFLSYNVDNECAIANNGYTKLIEQNDVYMKKDEEKMDSALAQLKEQFDALAKEHSNLKSLVESSILQEKARVKKKVEVTTVQALVHNILLNTCNALMLLPLI